MKIKHITLIMVLFAGLLSANAQIFNFSLRTNNQQLIDKALEGGFVRINQSYELCDTVNDAHFGRDGKDYFSIVPFVGVETERGLIFPSATLSPWIYDRDFEEYRDQYKPSVTNSKVSLLNSPDKAVRSISEVVLGENLSDHLSYLKDSTQTVAGFSVDTVPGAKDGWLIWITSDDNLAESDSVKYNSIKKDIEVPTDGGFLRLEKPELSGTVYGGIYVTPVQTGVGSISFTLTGVMVLDEEGWVLDFPFIETVKESKILTPIQNLGESRKLNQLKKKRK